MDNKTSEMVASYLHVYWVVAAQPV